MRELAELQRLLADLDDQLTTCMRCGMCQAVCPVYAETGREPLVARGKLALLQSLAGEMISDAGGVRDRLDTCLLCGACQAACPSGVAVLDIFLKARAILTAYMGLSPVKRAVFRGVLSRPRLFNRLMAAASRVQRVFTRPASDIVGSSCARFTSPLIGDRHFPPLAARPLHKAVPSLDTPRAPGGPKVAFFTGCLIDKIYPRVALAALEVLRRRGVGVFLPPDQACCGIPALSSGDRPAFEKLVRANLAAYGTGDFDYLLTCCATCTSTLAELWPAMCQGLPAGTRRAALELAAKTMDINQYLADVLGLDPAPQALPGAAAATMHDPCHLAKSLGVTAQPRAVAAMHPDYRLVEMADPQMCCGCGGSFTLQHQELSRRIGQNKRDQIVATGASVVLTGCPACMAQIGGLLSQNGDQVRVMHPVELLASVPDRG